MKISIFTPTHDPKYLKDLYGSIEKQDFDEWVIVPNNGCVVQSFNDVRVKVLPTGFSRGYVGELKKFAVRQCTGDIVLELDHDDLLTPSAIKDVKEAFKDESVGFVYSNYAEFKGNFEKTPRYSTDHGWNWRPYIHDKRFELDEVLGFPATPSSVSRVWYAPNHLRAWRKTVYDAIGGHNSNMRVLDDQEILCRTYLATKIKHIEKCLYLQRIHGENSWIKYNDEIQKNTIRLHDDYIMPMALKWATEKNLLKLDFGGAINPALGFETVDIAGGTDLEKPFPYADNSVGVIRAFDFLEHLPDKLHVIKEIYRVLAPDGILFSMTPSALAQGAFQDPTHKSYYVENSFKYYTEKRFAQYIGTPVRFQALRLYTTEINSDGVSWIVAQLMALKGQSVPGPVLI